MYLAEYFPGVEVEQIVENTGFEMDMSRAIETKPPDEGMLDILKKLM